MTVPRLPFKDSNDFREAVGLDLSQLEVDEDLMERVFQDPVALRIVSIVIAEFVQASEDPVIALLGEALLLQGPRKRSYLVRRIEDTLVSIYHQLGQERAETLVQAILASIHVRTMAKRLTLSLVHPESPTVH